MAPGRVRCLSVRQWVRSVEERRRFFTPMILPSPAQGGGQDLDSSYISGQGGTLEMFLGARLGPSVMDLCSVTCLSQGQAAYTGPGYVGLTLHLRPVCPGRHQSSVTFPSCQNVPSCPFGKQTHFPSSMGLKRFKKSPLTPSR